jgi:hypothetical protein
VRLVLVPVLVLVLVLVLEHGERKSRLPAMKAL